MKFKAWAKIKGEDAYLKGLDVIREGEEREILQGIIHLPQ
jgi:hypothetical protein